MDIEKQLLKIAEENVNKKLDEIRKENEEKIKKEIDDVNFILKLIEKKMLYKVEGRWADNQKFIMITKEIFLEDYMKKPESDWHKKGIQIKNWDSWKESYKLDITINEEIHYKHIGYIIKDFTDKLKEKQDRIYHITEGLNDLQRKFEELANQEKNIIKFVNDYNEINKKLNED